MAQMLQLFSRKMTIGQGNQKTVATQCNLNDACSPKKLEIVISASRVSEGPPSLPPSPPSQISTDFGLLPPTMELPHPASPSAPRRGSHSLRRSAESKRAA